MRPMKLYLGREQVKNTKGSSVKVFVVYRQNAETLSLDAFRHLLQEVCDALNPVCSDFVTFVPESGYLLCPERDFHGETVWSDILGDQQAMRELRR